MSRYRFRLETVLRVRRAEEADAKAALLRANGHLRRALEVRDAAQRRYRDVADAQGGPSTIEALVRDRWEAGLLADALALAQRDAMRAAGEAALAQVDWAQAARRVAVLERLDLRRRAEHAEEERRAENGALDDLVTARYAAGGLRGDQRPASPPSLRIVSPGRQEAGERAAP